MAQQGVVKVTRQNEERFDQAGRDHGDHDHRNGGDDLADDVGDNQQRDEGRDRRQRRAHHRSGHAAGAADRCLQRLHPAAVARFDMLADNNRVVDHDTDHHDQAEQADHIDRLTGRQHETERGQNG